MNSRTYPNITPGAAESFWKQANAAGFFGEGVDADHPATADFSYSQDLKVIGHGITLHLVYDRFRETAFVTVVSHPAFVFGIVPLTDDFILDRIAVFIEQAKKPAESRGAVCHPSLRIRPWAEDSASTKSYTPAQLRAHYGVTGTGEGQTIYIVELGGTYYEQDLKLAGINPDQVSSTGVDGATGVPDDNADGEVASDIQVALAFAPKAKVVVIYAQNTELSFYNGAAVSYKSQGGAYVPTCIATGDQGALDGSTTDMTDFPSCSRGSIACGGTEIVGSTEVVWNELANGNGAGGGGMSKFFPPNPWQTKLTYKLVSGKSGVVTGRPVPDCSLNADPKSGWIIYVRGEKMIIAGTSLSAPGWAGLIAAAQSQKGTRKATMSISWGSPEDQWTEAGRDNLDSLITQNADSGNNAVTVAMYANPHAFNDILPTAQANSNGDYSVTVGYDCATGLGVPKGSVLEPLIA